MSNIKSLLPWQLQQLQAINAALAASADSALNSVLLRPGPYDFFVIVERTALETGADPDGRSYKLRRIISEHHTLEAAVCALGITIADGSAQRIN